MFRIHSNTGHWVVWQINAHTIHTTVRPRGTVCVCVHQNFKALRQGCVIPFKETGAVKAALPQKLGERGTHSHIKWKGNLWCVSAQRYSPSAPPSPSRPCPLLLYTQAHTPNTIHTTSRPLTHSYSSYIHSACVFLLDLQRLLTSSHTTCRPPGTAAQWPVCELRAASVCELVPDWYSRVRSRLEESRVECKCLLLCLIP